MSVKSELSKARKEYNANPSLETLTVLKEKEEEYIRTPEGLEKFRKENPESYQTELLTKIVSLNARLGK